MKNLATCLFVWLPRILASASASFGCCSFCRRRRRRRHCRSRSRILLFVSKLQEVNADAGSKFWFVCLTDAV
ncbi:unnamed protein product, partial [Brassica napus]